MIAQSKQRWTGPLAALVLLILIIAAATLLLSSRKSPPSGPIAVAASRPAVATIPAIDLPGHGLPPSGPRGIFQTIPSRSYDASFDTRDNFDHVGHFTPNSWLRYNAFDFSPAPSSLSATLSCNRNYAGRIIQFHLDHPDGPVIAEVITRGTKGYETFTSPVKNAPTGLRDLFITCSDGGFNLKSFKFLRAQPATNPIRADSYSAAHGIQDRGDSIIGNTDGGDWLKYDQLDFGDGVASVNFYLAMGPRPEPAKLELRLDKPDGPLIAELEVRPTGAWTNFEFQQTPIKPTTGIHDLYLLFQGGRALADIKQFHFTPSPP